LDLLCQGAIVKGKQIDNMCMSTYESVCDYLVERGILKEINPRLYEIVGKE